jgi:hypothetical protein
VVAQPVGTVTFLFTDVEGSTRLLDQLGAELYAEVLEQHRRLLRDAFNRNEGYEFGTEGDAFFVAFARAEDALAAAAEAQQLLTAAEWPDGVGLRVRIGVHTGEPLPAGSNYVGIDVHRVARSTAGWHSPPGELANGNGRPAGSAASALLSSTESMLTPARLLRRAHEKSPVSWAFSESARLGSNQRPLACQARVPLVDAW